MYPGEHYLWLCQMRMVAAFQIGNVCPSRSRCPQCHREFWSRPRPSGQTCHVCLTACTHSSENRYQMRKFGQYLQNFLEYDIETAKKACLPYQNPRRISSL